MKYKKILLVLLLILSKLILTSCDNNREQTDSSGSTYYEITFETNGGSEVEKQLIEKNGTIEVPETQKTGYEFKGWFKDDKFTTKWEFAVDRVTKDITLYASWEKLEEKNENMKDIFTKLESTIYTNNIIFKDDTQLKPHLIGVDKERFLNEIKYPVPDVLSEQRFHVKDYQVSPNNEDNTPSFQSLINRLKTIDGVKVIYFDEGIYTFKDTVKIEGIQDLYIVGEKTTWMMNSWLSILEINNSEDIHLNYIDFDYAISPSISGEVVSVDKTKHEVVIKVDDEFDLTNHRYTNGKINYGNYMEYVYDEAYSAYIPDANGMLRYNSTGDRVKGIEDGTYDKSKRQLTLRFNLVQGPFIAPEIGKRVSVAFTMYEHPGIVISNSKNTYLETINIYTTPGMSIMGHSSENLYFNRTNIMLKTGSKRLMTATADGLHLGDCLGDVVITNSLYEASHDDAINIKTFYFKVDSFSRNKLNLSMTTTEIRIPINVGDQIEIYDGNSFKDKIIRTVTEVAVYGTSYELTLDQNISSKAITVGDLAANISRVPNVTIENSIFRNKRNRGILLQARNSIIKNNAFYNILHGPIMIHAAKDIFSEAVVPRNIVVENNKFFNNNGQKGTRSDISIFRSGGAIVENVIQNVIVRNNYISNSSENAIFLNGVGDIKVDSNLINQPAIRTSGKKGNNSAIYVNNAVDVTISNIYIHQEKDKQDYTHVFYENANNLVVRDIINLSEE